jgi:DNA-binding LacI/PurR family transcriptional regulator
MKNTITIKDVAKRLNVSISTVSRAFNDKYDIHPDTRRRDTGMQPKKWDMLLILWHSISPNIGRASSVSSSPNLSTPSSLLSFREYSSVLKEAGYQMLIMSSNEHYEEEVENVKMLERDHVDGISHLLDAKRQEISLILQELNITNANCPIQSE